MAFHPLHCLVARSLLIGCRPAEHLLIVPGARDAVSRSGRCITQTVASPPVPGSGVYRLLLRSDKVLRILREERPDVVEAQACGLPVVGVRAGAMLDRVPAGVGRLGAVDSPEEMAANIQALAADRREMGSRARRLVEAEFSWQRTFEQVFALYRRLNGERSRQHAGPWTWADREQPSRFSLAGRCKSPQRNRRAR